jgi:hypothetical protein
MIYLASPYSHPDPAVREQRYAAALLFTAQQLSEGIAIFSPIVYGHQLSIVHSFPTDAKSWASFNDDMLDICDRLWVLKLDGWEQSVGVAEEIRQAKALDLPISYFV